jgi:hypothetical protein
MDLVNVLGRDERRKRSWALYFQPIVEHLYKDVGIPQAIAVGPVNTGIYYRLIPCAFRVLRSRKELPSVQLRETSQLLLQDIPAPAYLIGDGSVYEAVPDRVPFVSGAFVLAFKAQKVDTAPWREFGWGLGEQQATSQVGYKSIGRSLSQVL